MLHPSIKHRHLQQMVEERQTLSAPRPAQSVAGKAQHTRAGSGPRLLVKARAG